MTKKTIPFRDPSQDSAPPDRVVVFSDSAEVAFLYGDGSGFGVRTYNCFPLDADHLEPPALLRLGLITPEEHEEALRVQREEALREEIEYQTRRLRNAADQLRDLGVTVTTSLDA